MTVDQVRSLGEELPAHGAWVRELARSLVRDEAAADDLAQDAALAALRQRGAIRGALAPFLASVTRNFARRGWRDAQRRRAREELAARPEAQPATDEAAARLEIQRRLVEELSALAPELRHALVKRYFDGWSAARIAREANVPAPTVRWRLQRGLAELRARLDRKDGGDGLQWRLALLPLCGPASPWASALDVLRSPAAAGTIQGALTMKAASQAIAALTLVAAVGVGVWWSTTRGESPRPLPSEAPVRVASELAAPVVPPAETRLAEPQSRELVEPAPRAASAPEPAVRPVEEAPRVVGRCVDEDLVPVAGARIALPPHVNTAGITSARDGTFSIPLRLDVSPSGTLQVAADGFATRFVDLALPARGTMPIGDVVLAPGGSVRGRVYGPDGAPFPGAAVTVTTPDLWENLESARAHGPRGGNLLGVVGGDDGRFEIAGVPVSSVRVWAGARGMRYAISPPVEVRAHESTDEVELRLERALLADRIHVLVLGPDGEPVPDAQLDLVERAGGGYTSNRVSADDDGRYELAAKPGRTYEIRASDPKGRWSSVLASDVGMEDEAVVLRFLEPHWMTVRVHGLASDSEGFKALAFTPDGEERLECANDLLQSDAVRLRIPGEPFVVRADARGFRMAEAGPFTPADAPSELTLELVPEPGVHGRVLAGGEPLAGARVALLEAPPNARIDHQGYLSFVLPEPVDEATTDAEGHFTLKLRKPGTFVVRASAEGHAPSDTPPEELDPLVGRKVELALGRGGSLEGRVLVAPGRDPSGVIVALNRGDASPRTQRSDAEGRFHFDGLTAGRWQLARGKQDFSEEGGGTAWSEADEPIVLPFNCTVSEGETTFQDLDLRDWKPCELAGLLRVNGAPASGWAVTGWPGGANAVVGELPSTGTASDGTFALTVEEPGRLRLSLSPPAELGGAGRIDVMTDVQPGPNEWQHDLPLGSLTGRCLSAGVSGERALFYNALDDGDVRCWLPVVPDESGRYSLPFVPAGRGVIRRLDGQDWTVVVETEVVAGQQRVVDLP